VTIRIQRCVIGEWCHVAVTYDGTSVRCYLDGYLVRTVETDYMITIREEEYAKANEALRRVIENEEAAAMQNMVEESKKEAARYFKTDAGLNEMLAAALEVLESPEFQAEDIIANKKKGKGGGRGGSGDANDSDGEGDKEDNEDDDEEAVLDDNQILKIRKKEALTRVKRKYAQELYERNVRNVVGEFRLRKKELEDRIRREREER